MSLQLVSQSAAEAAPHMMAAATTTLREFLAFRLGAEEHGRANAPDFIKGVADPRGVIVPIVGIGMVVDAVSDVITLPPEQLRPVPESNPAIASDHLLAIGAVQDRMPILVDIEKLMTSPELGLVGSSLR